MNETTNSIDQLVASGIADLKPLVDAGNTIARYWLDYIEAMPDVNKKLAAFGSMRIALISDARVEAIAVRKAMFHHE